MRFAVCAFARISATGCANGGAVENQWPPGVVHTHTRTKGMCVCARGKCTRVALACGGHPLLPASCCAFSCALRVPRPVCFSLSLRPLSFWPVCATGAGAVCCVLLHLAWPPIGSVQSGVGSGGVCGVLYAVKILATYALVFFFACVLCLSSSMHVCLCV